MLKNPLIVALDVDTAEEALALSSELAGVAGGFKLGPRLSIRYGAELLSKIAKKAPVFLDNKHFDIPSTMESAVRASFDAGATLVTVHAMSGPEALLRMAKVEQELSSIRPFKILAVTVLTSWSEKSFASVYRQQSIGEHVQNLVDLVQDCGMSGVVCSPHELDLLQNRDLYLVTPGIRFSMAHEDDQNRVMNSQEALNKGAKALVVGRPILQAVDRVEAAQQILATIYEKK